MSVVTDMGASKEYDDEPTWDEAAAAFDAATPVELVRSPRQVTVVYRYTDGLFTATSPDLRGFRATGRTLLEVKDLVSQDLSEFLDPAVEVMERLPAAGAWSCTAAASHGFMIKREGKLPELVVLTSSAAPAPSSRPHEPPSRPPCPRYGHHDARIDHPRGFR
jgi:hypothetical protein